MDPERAKQAARAICCRILALPAYRRARRVALFLAFDGEPDLTRLARSAAAQRKELFVPVLTRKTMRFARLVPRAYREYFPGKDFCSDGHFYLHDGNAWSFFKGGFLDE